MVPNAGDWNFQFSPTGMDPMDPILDPTECRFINILLMISFSHNQILSLSSGFSTAEPLTKWSCKGFTAKFTSTLMLAILTHSKDVCSLLQ
jgi:hypothetical protein